MTATAKHPYRRPSANGKKASKLQGPGFKVLDSENPHFIARLLMATPSRGMVRIEWHLAVRALAIPPNWAAMSMVSKLNEFVPVRYTVADAQNLITREVIQGGYEWLFLLEDDVMPPPDLLIRLSAYMTQGKKAPPVISGLYFQKSRPSEPVLYRGRGNGAFADFKIGQKVWADGVPTGCLLIHASILHAMWNESPEYRAMGELTRQVFESPARAFLGVNRELATATGTSDLEFCRRLMEEDFFKKAGYPNYQRKKWPFLCDTRMLCSHIAQDGTTYP